MTKQELIDLLEKQMGENYAAGVPAEGVKWIAVRHAQDLVKYGGDLGLTDEIVNEVITELDLW